jgi:UDP-N-acetylmuramyl pentapeptide synthase
MPKRNLLFRYRRAKINLISQLLDRSMRQVLARHRPKIIAVTGSIGKTSAKVAIAQLLATRYRLYIEDQNHNSDRTIRLNFFGLPFPKYNRWLVRWVPVLWSVHRRTKDFPFDVVVLEMAESRHASSGAYIKELQPDIGVISGVSPAHLSYFHSYDRLVAAVWKLASMCQQIIYNADFPDLAEQANAAQAKTFGIQHGVVSIRNITTQPDGKLAGNLVIDKKSAKIQTNMVATQSLYAVAAAAAVAHELGWSLDEIAAAVPMIEPVRGRMNPVVGRQGTVLLDDTFNASPISVLAALKTLNGYTGKKIAVLGSMNELSDTTQEAHEKIGQRAAEVVDELVVIGDTAGKYLAPAAIRAGLDAQHVHVFARANQAGACLRAIVEPGATILFKGSQDGVFTEEAIKYVMDQPNEADKILIRQNGSWKRRKQGFFAETIQQEISS